MLTGTSQKFIRKLMAYKQGVAPVCDELQDDRLAGFRVLQQLRESHQDTAAIMLLRRPHRAAWSKSFVRALVEFLAGLNL